MVSAKYKIQGMKKTYVEAVAAAKGVLRSTITKSFVTSFVPKRLFPLGRLTFRGQIIESSKGQSLESLPGPSLSWQHLLSTSSLWRSAFSSASPASPSRQPNPHSEDKLLNIATLSRKKSLLHLNFASTIAAHQELSVCVGAHACVAHLRTKVDLICIIVSFVLLRNFGLIGYICMVYATDN